MVWKIILIVFLCALIIKGIIFKRKPGLFFFKSAQEKNKEEQIHSEKKASVKLFSAERVYSTRDFNFTPFLILEKKEEPEIIDEKQRNLAHEALSLAQENKSDSLEQALKISKILKTDYPHFYFGYYIASLVNLKLNKVTQAKEELEKGILSSQQKYALYAAIGSLAYDCQDVNYALAWWMKSVVAQCSTGKVTLGLPFVFLGHAAHNFKLEKIAEAFFSLVKKADQNSYILNEKNREKFYLNLKEKGAQTAHPALIALYTEHLSKIIY